VSPTIAVRTAVRLDLPELRRLFRRSALSNPGDRANLLAHPETLVFADEPVDEGRTRVAVSDARIVGFATLLATADSVELEDLFVDPDWMRGGIGRALVLDALATAGARGATRIDLTANPHARGFYEKLGFVPDGVESTRFGPAERMHLAVPASAAVTAPGGRPRNAQPPACGRAPQNG
jgi:GNAT superfamily N-acetyltransferase